MKDNLEITYCTYFTYMHNFIDYFYRQNFKMAL